MIHDRTDITAEDREGRLILVGKAHYDETSPDDRLAMRNVLNTNNPTAPFVMLIDPGTIWIYGRTDQAAEGHDAGDLKEVCRLDAAEVISHYAQGYDKSMAHRGFKPFNRRYLIGMVSSWLSDVAELWKPGEPPKLEELHRIGLLEPLRGGDVTNQDMMRDRSVS